MGIAMDLYGINTQNDSIFSFEKLARQKELSQASHVAPNTFSVIQDEEQSSANNNSNQIKPHSLIDQNRSISEYVFTLSEQSQNDVNVLANKDSSGNEATNSNDLPEFNVSVLEKLKSGMSFQDAILAVKAERFQMYFEEALAANGGDVRGALERAEAQLRKETQLSNEDLYAVVQELGEEYTQAARETGSQELQRIADELGKYLEELEGKVDIEKIPNLNKSESFDNDEELTLKNQFIADIITESDTKSQNNITNTSHKLSEKEVRELDNGIKQYEKVASLS